uniref:Uncharacterized protein n=1 Tax=Leersia perrieri TaxID=77586 RepID=A0A0D9W6C6_9ORYZ
MAAGGLLRRIHDREWSAWRIHNNDTTARGSGSTDFPLSLLSLLSWIHGAKMVATSTRGDQGGSNGHAVWQRAPRHSQHPPTALLPPIHFLRSSLCIAEAMVQTGASWDVDGVDSAGKAVHMCIRSNLARARQLGEQEQDLADLRLQRRRPAAGGRAAASATRALAKGTIFEDVISTIKEVIPWLSCPAALFT